SDPGDNVVPVEQPVRGPLPAGLDHERLDAPGADALVRRREATSSRIAHAEPVPRRLQRGLRGRLRRLYDLVTPLAPEKRQADAGFVAVVRVDEDRVPRS